MKKPGEMGQKVGSSLLASPHLSVLMAHFFIISPAKSAIHLPGKSCDTKESHESFALHENMKDLIWDHRFPLAIHVCTPTITLDPQKRKFWTVESGIKDILVYYRLFKFLYLPSLFSLHQCWKIDFSSYFFVAVALCLAQHTSGRRNYPTAGKRKM